MRKGLTILLIIILLAAGGFWLYGKFFAPVDDSANNINQAIPPLPQNHQEPPLDLNINLSASEQLATSTERIDQKPATTTPQSNLSQVEVDKTIKISILNGSGTTGQAGKLAGTLEEAGWLDTVTGNADNFKYQNLTIRYQPQYQNQSEEIKKLLLIDYSLIKLEEKENLSSMIEIIIGK